LSTHIINWVYLNREMPAIDLMLAAIARLRPMEVQLAEHVLGAQAAALDERAFGGFPVVEAVHLNCSKKKPSLSFNANADANAKCQTFMPVVQHLDGPLLPVVAELQPAQLLRHRSG
jgi:hypothetical protein